MTRPGSSRTHSGFTLIEVLIATALSLLLMSTVIVLFGRVVDAVSSARAMLESNDRLRFAAARLQQDLSGATADLTKTWHRPEDNEGYFEYIEGPVTQTVLNDAATANAALAISSDISSTTADTTVGDFDDILMLTTQNTSQPFAGRVPTTVSSSGVLESDTAEVVWFLRGRTLYRRVLLVKPETTAAKGLASTGFYANNDLSIRANYGSAWQASTVYSLGDVVASGTHYYACTTAGASGSSTPSWPTDGSTVTDGTVVWTDRGTVPPVALNSLGDLAMRENRYAHNSDPTAFPFDIGGWSWTLGSNATYTYTLYTLPTLHECSLSTWVAGSQTPTALTPATFTTIDMWSNNPALRPTDTGLTAGAGGSRIADDVILTNVIGFDVKAWDPVVGDYVDLGNGSGIGVFTNPTNKVGTTASGTEFNLVRVYDTWPTSYEYTGVDSNDQATSSMGDGTTATRAGRAVNGVDDYIVETTTGKNGIVDDSVEYITSPPYSVPLRGIQVKIRMMEPDSRQVREVTVVQNFLPK